MPWEKVQSCADFSPLFFTQDKSALPAQYSDACGPLRWNTVAQAQAEVLGQWLNLSS